MRIVRRKRNADLFLMSRVRLLHGSFTVVAEASPTWLPHLESPLEEKRVREYLEQSGPVDVQQRLEFTLSRTGYTEDDAWKQDFTSRPAVLQLNFSVKGRHSVFLLLRCWTIC